MEPIRTKESNALLDPPPGMEGAIHIPAHAQPTPAGGVVVFSVWEPTEQERQLIADGGQVKIALNCSGPEMIPLHDVRAVEEPEYIDPEEPTPEEDGRGLEEPQRPPAPVSKLHIPGRDFDPGDIPRG